MSLKKKISPVTGGCTLSHNYGPCDTSPYHTSGENSPLTCREAPPAQLVAKHLQCPWEPPPGGCLRGCTRLTAEGVSPEHSVWAEEWRGTDHEGAVGTRCHTDLLLKMSRNALLFLFTSRFHTTSTHPDNEREDPPGAQGRQTGNSPRARHPLLHRVSVHVRVCAHVCVCLRCKCQHQDTEAESVFCVPGVQTLKNKEMVRSPSSETPEARRALELMFVS